MIKPKQVAFWTRGGTRCLRFGCADLGALHTGSSTRSASSRSEKTDRLYTEERKPISSSGGGGRSWRREDGPERNSGVFPQEAEPEAGGGGAGESEHPEA